MLEKQQVSIMSGALLSSQAIVDEVMQAHHHTDYHLGRGYGPPAIGSSSKATHATIEQLREELHQTKEDRATLEARVTRQDDRLTRQQAEIDQVYHLTKLNSITFFIETVIDFG